MSFLSIGILDILDIIIVAFLLYQFYMLIKGTVAINIFVGIFTVYLVWLLVKALNMNLLGTILGQFMGVGVIALIIVFQQEIRRFLLLVGTRYFANRNFSLENVFSFFMKTTSQNIYIKPIVDACVNLSKTKTGALIVIANQSKLTTYAETGEVINAKTSMRLLQTIFFKNSPLHDGAVIISGEKIFAAACVLPVSSNKTLPKNLGLRHRAALGLTETTDAFVVIVSEETGHISYSHFGKIRTNINAEELYDLLNREFKDKPQSEPAKGKKIAMSS